MLDLRIIGAGLAGLLAGNLLSHRQPVIYEKQKELPNNHSAVLRFRSSIIGDNLRIPFKKVQMIKATVPWRNPVADALSYSRKNGGVTRSDRSITQGLVTAERWIAPPDLISRMAAACSITFEMDALSPHMLEALDRLEVPHISTIPMPTLMRALNYPVNVEFKSVPGMNYRARLPNCDAYVSLLVPDPEWPFSRLSLTGDELIVEAIGHSTVEDPNEVLSAALWLLGFPEEKMTIKEISATASQYAKIMPIPEEVRKDFMFWATDKHNIFSLGRFATWRPGLLLDDLVKDVRLIDGWLDRKNRYAAARHR